MAAPSQNSDPTASVPALAIDALFGRESRALAKFSAKWRGLRVTLHGRSATVLGVGDDGAQCDHDERRRYKPTGMLIVRPDGCSDDDIWLAELVTILPNAEISGGA